MNIDYRIGLEEAVYALRDAADIKPGRAQAVLGPLAGADVKVYRLRDLENPVYTDQTEADGYFDTYVSGINGAEYILVAVSGGQDIDADDDGVTDAVPTANTGTIHAIMTVAEFNAGGFKVTALSDIAWQYVRNMVGQVDEGGLRMRLDDLAKHFFSADVNGDSALDAGDICAFMPTDTGHKNKLNFDWQNMFEQNTDGNSIIGCYHNNLPDVLPQLLENNFGTRLTLNPTADFRYEKVRIEVIPFGRGNVKSNAGAIDFDSERTDVSKNIPFAFYDESADGKVTLTAAPTSETEILSWDGCDSVSEDKTQCECSLKDDRLITINFGYKETVLQGGVSFVDLSNAAGTFSTDQVTINLTAGTGDTDTKAKLAALKAGDIVVGSAGGGFLRKIISTQKVSDDNYILTTEDASLDEVIAQGTGGFTKQMTHGDIVETPTARSNRSGDSDLVHLVPSDDPNDRVFRIEIGELRQDRALSGNLEGTLNWPNNTDPQITLKGAVEIMIDVETGVSFRFGLNPLEYFKFVPKITATENLDVTLINKLETDALEFKLHTFHFTPISFAVGPVPVWIEPQVTIYLGIEAKVGGAITAGITLRQEAKFGIVYNHNAGVDLVTGFKPSYEFTPPTAQIYAEVGPYVKTSPSMQIYSTTGPKVNLKGYLKFRGEAELPIFEEDVCDEGIKATAYWGIASEWEWDLNHLKKLGKWADNIEIKGELADKYEQLIKKWNIGGNCGQIRLPFMDISGLDFFDTAEKGAGSILQKQYTITNDGDLKMDWEISYIEDGITNVSPSSGSIEKGQSQIVTVSVNTEEIDLGLYRNYIKFKNLYDGGWFSSLFNGSQNKYIFVLVTPPPLSDPIMAQPQMAKDSGGNVIASVVNLSWSYPDINTIDYIDGYELYMSKTPDMLDSWQKIDTVTDASADSYQVANLLPDTLYFFRMTAYGAYMDTAVSEMFSIKTPPVLSPPPDGDFTNSLGMSFVELPAGTFMMGSPAEELTRDSHEYPQHSVTVQSFYMQTTEVTQEQWQAVMGTNPSYFTECGGDCPVEQVSWDDIQLFIVKMNEHGEGTYRLPTEAEWEYAARAGSTTAFANGDIINIGHTPVDPSLDAVGWYLGNSEVTYDLPNTSTKGIHSVSQKLGNSWGLFDMHGNVKEWVEDDWHSNYTDAPVDGSAWIDAPRGYNRVLRGGSWNSFSHNCRSAYRWYNQLTGRGNLIGFRLALSPNQ